MAIWTLRQSSADIERLATSTGLEPVLARILAVRGFRDPQAIYDFLHPQDCALADPSSFRDMEAALNVACHAIDTQRKCCIFGDYDADGIMSTVILIRTMKALGADVSYYIPQRENEGYGLNDQALDNLKHQGVEVIFACDNGISAFEQAQHAAELGLTLVILDHHAVTVNDGEQQLPKAAAVVDAKRLDCVYPFKEYCAAGLCYRFSEALFRRLNRDWSSLGEQLLPFAAIGTVCDLVELVGENRVLVSRGLPKLPESSNFGLQALIEANGLQDHPLDTYHVGFILGPCINASGRLDIADTAVELFLADNKGAARNLATRLVELNQHRRQLTEEGAKIAFQMIEEQGLDNDKVIVLYCDELQESVAGIIAGRVKEKYYRPSVIIVGRGDLVRGSCRSVEGYNIYQGLFACRDLLPAFGGHPMAAGLSIAISDIPELRRRLNIDFPTETVALEPQQRIDCPLLPSLTNLNLAQSLTQIAPFGKGNPCPLFAAKSLSLTRLNVLGKNENVLRWYLRQPDGQSCEAIDFFGKNKLYSMIEETAGSHLWHELLQGRPSRILSFDIIYQLNVNRFNGRETAQLQIIDFRPGE